MMGDPLAPYISEKTTEEQAQELREKHNLDDPIHVQYVTYLQNIITFDWGYSKTINQPVSEALREKFAATLELSILAFIVAVGTAIPLGIFSSIRHNRWEDHAIRLFALFGSAIPIFWFALVLKYVISFQLGWLPLGDRYDAILWDVTDPIEIKTNFLLIDALAAGSYTHFIDALKHMILPATVLAYGSMATIIRLMRGNMLDVLGQDYVRTAKSKGLSEREVTLKHGASNAMIPTVTLLGMGFAGLINGSVLTETVFTWPGLGYWAITAMKNLDVSAILAYTLFSAILYIFANLVVDILYAFLDPRVELEVSSNRGEIAVISLSLLMLFFTFISIPVAVTFAVISLLVCGIYIAFSSVSWLSKNPDDIWLPIIFVFTLFVVWTILTGWFTKIVILLLILYSIYIFQNWDEIKPEVYPRLEEMKRAAYQVRRNPLTMLGLIIVISLLSIALFAPFLAPPSETQRDPMEMEEHFDYNFDLQPPCYFSCTGDSGEEDGYVLGSTTKGYDIYYGIVWGSRTSLDVALKVVTTGTFIAAVIGVISGYYGGRTDDFIMRITDVFIAIPGLVLALALMAVTGNTSIEYLMYALIIVWWPGFTRVVRAEALRIRKLPYIEAAKAAGATDFRIIFKHVLPNCVTSIVVIATMDMGGIVLSLAGLGFLGFGGGPSLAEWGKLVSFGQAYLLAGYWWAFFFPGLVIALWALGFYLLGDGIRDVLDPRQRS
jgi:ABC-type dipeptide/oligopeptide/nickel transport system permease component